MQRNDSEVSFYFRLGEHHYPCGPVNAPTAVCRLRRPSRQIAICLVCAHAIEGSHALAIARCTRILDRECSCSGCAQPWAITSRCPRLSVRISPFRSPAFKSACYAYISVAISSSSAAISLNSRFRSSVLQWNSCPSSLHVSRMRRSFSVWAYSSMPDTSSSFSYAA